MQNNSYLFFAIPIIAFLLWVLWFFPIWQIQKLRKRLSEADQKKIKPVERLALEKDIFSSENSLRATVAQIFGGMFILITGITAYQTMLVTEQNTEVAQKNLFLLEQGNLTERFNKAAEMLGSEKIEIKLGGIYALERVSSQSVEYHWPAMEILTTYIRRHTKEPSSTSLPILSSNMSYIPKPVITIRDDIQASITVIGRRKWLNQESARTLDLHDSNLSGANLRGSNFRAANFTNTKLIGTILEYSDLSYADFNEADLFDAKFKCSDVKEAKMEKTKNLDIEKLLKMKNPLEAKIPLNLKISLISFYNQNPEFKNVCDK